jgi:hypothetical protein
MDLGVEGARTTQGWTALCDGSAIPSAKRVDVIRKGKYRYRAIE